MVMNMKKLKNKKFLSLYSSFKEHFLDLSKVDNYETFIDQFSEGIYMMLITFYFELIETYNLMKESKKINDAKHKMVLDEISITYKYALDKIRDHCLDVININDYSDIDDYFKKYEEIEKFYKQFIR